MAQLSSLRDPRAPGARRPAAPTADDGGILRGLARTARPRQWVKNLLVLAAPLAGAALTDLAVLLHSAGAFAAFCLVASGGYFLNDAQDVEADRRHPTKRTRPVAAGTVPVPAARAAGVGLYGAGLALAYVVSPGLLGLVAVYVVMTTAYSFGLKQIPVLDIAVVSLGFVVRALAGGVATGVPMTDWFVIVVSFGALFLAAGKRFAEARRPGAGTMTRDTLRDYSAPFLRHVTFAAATVTILAYCAWLFDQPGSDVWLTVSVLPLVLALLRYLLLLEHGRGEAPEEVLLADHPLQVLAVVWLATFVTGTYIT